VGRACGRKGGGAGQGAGRGRGTFVGLEGFIEGFAAVLLTGAWLERVRETGGVDLALGGEPCLVVLGGFGVGYVVVEAAGDEAGHGLPGRLSMRIFR